MRAGKAGTREKKRARPRTGSAVSRLRRLKQAEDSLRRSEERYALATSAAVEGIYEWDVEKGDLFLTNRAKAFLSFSGEQLTPAAWNTRIHAEDYTGYRAAIVDHFKGRTPQIEHEYRISDGLGGYRWVLDRGIGVRDARGRVTKLVGAVSDITQRKRAEVELRRARDQAEEALKQQTATAEILRVMSGSPTDVLPVFEAIVKSGIRLFEGAGVTVACPENGRVQLMAIAERDPERIRRWKERFPFPLTREYMHGVAILDCRMVDMPDVEKMDESFAAGKRNFAASGYRAMTVVPMVKDGAAIGTIAVVRDAPGPLGEKQIALLKTFADQAVIAIENVRLFNETTEALAQQTATAEILKMTSQSPADVKPVFEAILANASKLCEANVAAVFLYDGEVLTNVAQRNASPEFAHFMRGVRSLPSLDTTCRRCALERRTVHTADLLSDPEFAPPEAHRRENIRTVLSVPMIRDGSLMGVITLWRREVRPFTAKQISLVETFAQQAVLAIENVRLVNETKEALEQQKASGEVLAVISSAIADTAPVFDKILESCQRLFAGTIVGLNLVGEDGKLHIGAYHGAHRREFERIVFPIPLTSASGSGLSIIERRVVHYPDTENGADVPERTRQGCKTIGIKSVIFAPVLWEGRGLGAIFVGRDRVSSFAEREISLLRTFADQAAIAIENVHLFKEIQEKSRQLEVASRHKSEFLANMSHELRTPLNAIIGFTRIVMRRSQERLEPQQRENLEKILASGQHLLALINSILDLAKVEAGRVEVNPSEIALSPVLESCARTVEPLVRADAVTLVKELDGGLPQMYVDEEKLRQIVINLLSNAAKFTEHGSIHLQAHASNGTVAIAVADTGIGIAPDKLEVIFEEFAQADASSTRVYGGTGLGLTIARRLARLMGGEITAESALGSGSRFTLTLPLRYSLPGT